MSTVVTSKGQVTIPKRVRDYLGIKASDAVDFELTSEGSVVLVKTRGERKRSPFSLIRGSATVKMSTDEIMALTREHA